VQDGEEQFVYMDNEALTVCAEDSHIHTLAWIDNTKQQIIVYNT
jgi:uncharacterized protein YacL (UPF0231 family)